MSNKGKKMRTTCKKRGSKDKTFLEFEVKDLRKIVNDPLAKKKRRKKKKTLETKEEPSIPITPSLGTRAKLTEKPDVWERHTYINPKAVKPKPPVVTKKLIPPCPTAKMELKTPGVTTIFEKVEAPSAQIKKKKKVKPRIATPTQSQLVPPTDSELEKDQPDADTTITRTKTRKTLGEILKDIPEMDSLDSFEHVVVKEARPLVKKYVILERTYRDKEKEFNMSKGDETLLTELREELEDLREKMEYLRGQLVTVPDETKIERKSEQVLQVTTFHDETKSNQSDLWHYSHIIHDRSTAPWIKSSDVFSDLDYHDMTTKILEDTKSNRSKNIQESVVGQGDVIPELEEDYCQLEDQLGAAGDMGEGEEADALAIENYLTKQFRKKVSQHSKATSYHVRDTYTCPQQELTDAEILGKLNADKILQKFCPIEEEVIPERKFQRGTLESHSFTEVKLNYVRDFCFGSKAGTMHINDEHLYAHGTQGICTPIAAYCFAFLKHPARWSTEDIDEILVSSSNLYKQCCDCFRIQEQREITYQELDKYCYYANKKLKFLVDEPEISGFLFSLDKTIFNLNKALKIFFARKDAGILVAKGINIGIWKHKYYYMFDGVHRTKDLYISESGVANVANFYDIDSLATVLMQRSGYSNIPFCIHAIRVLKIYDRHIDYREDELDFANDRDNYNLITEEKAVLLGSFHLSDLCFKYMRNKQAVSCCTIALVYSRMTPSSAWTRTTIDKIMILGTKLCQECLKCDNSEVLLIKNLPAYFSLGPYIVEIYIHENLYCDSLFKRCKCQLLNVIEEFFNHGTNALVDIDKTMFAIFQQRCKYFLFDPYSRNFEATTCRDGAACVSMHTTIASLVNTIIANIKVSQEVVFHVHGLKVCKIIRNPRKFKEMPMCVKMNDVTIDAFKGAMVHGGKKAVQRPVGVDFSRGATQSPFQTDEEMSVFQMGLGVESLLMEEIPKFPDKMTVKEEGFMRIPINVDDIVDLDSPSLADTQAPQKPLEDPEEELAAQFRDICSFDLTLDEVIYEPVLPDAEGGENIDNLQSLPERRGSEVMSEVTRRMLERCKMYGGYPPIDEGEGEGEGEDVDLSSELEYFYAQAQFIQVNQQSLDIAYVGRISEMVNTDLTACPMELTVLPPTNLREKIDSRRMSVACRANLDNVLEPDLTQSMELMKPTNFRTVPDDSQLVKGTKNLIAFDANVEYVAPFMCVMAGIVSRKYSLGTWSSDIVDYVLNFGYELYVNSPVRYDQVSKLDIPKISLGSMDFQVTIQYVFDSYLKEKMIELAIDKIMLSKSNIGILVTPSYCCTIFYKNFLYYLFDPFGNNQVGLSTGPKNEGTAAIVRFKTVQELVRRILLNKRKREMGSKVEYCRFVLSVVTIKTMPTTKKPKKFTEQPEDFTDIPEEQASEIDQEEDLEQPNKVGYQSKNGLWVIEGSQRLPERNKVEMKLKNDHFVSLCACLMTLTCPVQKWDTKKVDTVISHGDHIFKHAQDLNISNRRIIKNVLIGRNFFDIILKKHNIDTKLFNTSISVGVETLFSWKYTCFMIQLPSSCYAVSRTEDGIYHFFDPYGPINFRSKKEVYQAGWVRCASLQDLQKRLRKLMKHQKVGTYQFYVFEVTSIRKAPKEIALRHKLYCTCDEKPKDKEVKFGKPFYEDVEWLKVDPIPWSRMILETPTGNRRGSPENKWNFWDIEYPKDLFSMTSNINQQDERFSPETRGKQTLANIVVCIGMLHIYDLPEFNPPILDSILVNGDHYIQESINEDEETTDLKITDLKEECTIFPYKFKVIIRPASEGTMYVVRNNKFNLYKALREFFQFSTRRFGMIFSKGEGECPAKHLAFGRTKPEEFFVFDCETQGKPMFLPRRGRAYILRMTTLNRLTHVLTLTMRGGDFFIFEIKVKDLKPMGLDEEEEEEA